MLSKSSGNQKSMWTKLPAALKWISAVHHCTLDDTFHQLNTKHDKELLRNNLLFSIQKYCIKWEKTVSHASHIISVCCTRHMLRLVLHIYWIFFHLFSRIEIPIFHFLGKKKRVGFMRTVARVQLPSQSWMSDHKSSDRQQWAPGCRGD